MAKIPLYQELERKEAVIKELVEALKACLPSIKADNDASHLLDGFRHKANKHDLFLWKLQDLIKKAEQEK